MPEWGGAFEVRVVEDGGLESQKLLRCELGARTGGEQFQRTGKSTPRSLKKQFQAARVPAWQRTGPLVYSGRELLYVPGLGIDARALARRGAPMLSLRWLPTGAATGHGSRCP